MDYRSAAQQCAAEGYNCCQSVFLAFCDELGMDKKTAAMLSGGLGAGFSRKGEVCGAVSGAIMAFGLREGFWNPKDDETKMRFVHKVQNFMDEFRAKHGAVTCRALLNFDISTEENYAQAAERGIFAAKCSRLIGDAAEMIVHQFEAEDAS